MAIDLDGVDQYVETADQGVFSPFVNDMSISIWAMVPTGATAKSSGAFIMAKGGSSNWEWGLYNKNNTSVFVSLWKLSGSTHGGMEDTRTMNDGEWHHYAVTFDYQTIARLYVDGVEVASDNTFNGDMGDGTEPVRIGAKTTDNLTFEGSLDDARIYNRILSPSEIQTIYASRGVDGIVDSLVGRWLMNEASPGTVASGAGTVKDHSGQGNDGEPKNSPSYIEGELRFRRRTA